ncbi:cytochrome c1 [Methylobrevis sp. L22]|uniref:Cytochrome c1 n=2 Tax=Methylobrevis albus TaxID=2793297 RepID=A0A931HZS2_9HYPH|nr:cytochrome c1 [Methylobrevis albus]MBH0236673.1 cytochrome c1 [Methylobrevis albus]
MKSTIARVAVAAVIGFGLAAGAAHAAEEGEHATPHYPLIKPERMTWSFAGPFGTYDPGQLQRGLKVYREVCSACHGLTRVAFRTLGQESGPRFEEGQVRTIAAEYQVMNADPDENGDMFERAGEPKDHFPSPYANEVAAAASNGGAAPPDLSLIAKARAVERGLPWFIFDMFLPYQEQGADYLHALLTGYQEPPEGVEVAEGTYYNPYFIAGQSLKMPPPMSDDQVEYTDGSPQTVEQYSRDVSAFLMWAAEPHLVERKQMGFRVIIFLIVFAGLLYATKKKIWSKAH